MNEKQKIELLFKENPELATAGSQEQYAQYLKTIFPKSSTSLIFFHGGRKGIETFTPPSNKEEFRKNKGVNSGTKDYGIYFTADKSLAEQYARGHKKNDRQVYSVILNMENPLKTNAWFALNIRKALGFKDLLNPQSITKSDYHKFIESKGHDSILWHGEKGEAIVFDPKQIHILGSRKDIEMFQKWSEKRKERTETRDKANTSQNSAEQNTAPVAPRQTTINPVLLKLSQGKRQH